jgi:hypothetical protein
MNKKSRASRPRSVTDLLAEPLPTAARPARARIRQLESRSRELESEIERLECSIAAAPALLGQRRLATRDTLPPLRSPAAGRGRPQPSRLPQVQRQAIRRARLSKLLELLIVFGILAAALGWMNQHFHWWDFSTP